jgi:hypothetical protein
VERLGTVWNALEWVAPGSARRIVTKGITVRRLRLASLLLAAAAAAVSLASAAPASAEPADDFPTWWNWTKNMGSGLCLQPLDGSFAQGEVITQENCDLNSTLQRWEAINVNGDVFQLRNVATGFCLDVNGRAANRTPVQQWTCNTSSNQKWDAGFNTNILRSRVSGTDSHCLDVPAASLQPRVAVQIYRCTNNNLAQNWDIFGPVILNN